MIIKNKWLPVFFCHVLCLTAIEAVALIQNPVRRLAVYSLLRELYVSRNLISDWFGTVYTWSKSVSHTNRVPHTEHTGDLIWFHQRLMLLHKQHETNKHRNIISSGKSFCQIRMNPALMNNAWMNKWMNKMNEPCMYEWMTEWTNPACMNECINELINEWNMHELMNGWLNEWTLYKWM